MISIIIIAVTGIISWFAWQRQDLFYNLCFYPYRIFSFKEWWRVITGGFIHADTSHLFFNMFSFYFFAPVVSAYFTQLLGALGGPVFILFYLVSIVISGLPDLLMHRGDDRYTAVGASGGVSAVVFASIFFQPKATIIVLFFPMPAILYGVLYLAYTAYMAKRGGDGIGHMAHFTGAMFGFMFPLVLEPRLFSYFIQQLLGR
jgi:membrane associated rhomboid family serine protease